MLVRLWTWWDSPYGWIAPGQEVDVDPLDGAMLCSAGLAEPVRDTVRELAVVGPREVAQQAKPKRRRKR